MIPINMIEDAASRIGPYVRRTPFIRARHTKEQVREGELLLKLENLQVTGAFKVRGAINAALGLSPEQRERGLVAASGGNHAVAVAYTAHALGTSSTVYMPSRALPEKVAMVERWGGRVKIVGETWDDAHADAIAYSSDRELPYIHPFADDNVMAGQGTIGLEMMKQSSHCEIFVVSIGGGGLISGIASAIKAKKPNARIYGVEPEGAPTLSKSLEANEAICLPSIRTEAITLAPRQSSDRNIELIRECVDGILLVSDDEMREAARWLWLEFGLSVELSGAACVAAVKSGLIKAGSDDSVGVIVCGAGSDGIARL